MEPYKNRSHIVDYDDDRNSPSPIHYYHLDFCKLIYDVCESRNGDNRMLNARHTIAFIDKERGLE